MLPLSYPLTPPGHYSARITHRDLGFSRRPSNCGMSTVEVVWQEVMVVLISPFFSSRVRRDEGSNSRGLCDPGEGGERRLSGLPGTSLHFAKRRPRVSGIPSEVLGSC